MDRKKLLDLIEKMPTCECVEIRDEKMREAQRLGLPGASHYCEKCKMSWVGTSVRKDITFLETLDVVRRVEEQG